MSDTVNRGYLARVEANFAGIRAAPGAVFLRLTRAFPSESQVTHMFTEMTATEALKLICELQAAVTTALGTDAACLASPAPRSVK